MIESDVSNGFYVEDMDIVLRMVGMENRFENLMHNEELSELFNKAISKIAPEAIDILWPDLKCSVEEEVRAVSTYTKETYL